MFSSSTRILFLPSLVSRCILSSPSQNSPFRLPNPLCSLPSLGKSQLSLPISFVSLSTLHLLLFGRSKHQKGRHHLDWSCRHHWFFRQLCTDQHSFYCCLGKGINSLQLFAAVLFGLWNGAGQTGQIVLTLYAVNLISVSLHEAAQIWNRFSYIWLEVCEKKYLVL